MCEDRYQLRPPAIFKAPARESTPSRGRRRPERWRRRGGAGAYVHVALVSVAGTRPLRGPRVARRAAPHLSSRVAAQQYRQCPTICSPARSSGESEEEKSPGNPRCRVVEKSEREGRRRARITYFIDLASDRLSEVVRVKQYNKKYELQVERERHAVARRPRQVRPRVRRVREAKK